MREVWIDRWKGLLILLVVVGHVVGGAARFLPGRGLATLGGLSLTILLVHKFPVMALETQVPWMRQLFQTGCWGAVLGCLVVTILALIGCGLVHGIMRKYLPFAIGLKKGENK